VDEKDCLIVDDDGLI